MKRLDDAPMQTHLNRPRRYVAADYARRAQFVHSRQLLQDVKPLDSGEIQQKIRQLKTHANLKGSIATARQIAMLVPHPPQPSRVLMRPSSTVMLQKNQKPAYRPTIIFRLRRKLWRVPLHGEM